MENQSTSNEERREKFRRECGQFMEDSTERLMLLFEAIMNDSFITKRNQGERMSALCTIVSTFCSMAFIPLLKFYYGKDVTYKDYVDAYKHIKPTDKESFLDTLDSIELKCKYNPNNESVH